MNAIDDIQVELDTANAALVAMVPIVANISADVDNLQAQVAALSAGSLTPEQLAKLKATSDSMTTNIGSLTDALNTTDAKTPPVTP